MAETLKIKDLPAESRPREAFMRSANPVADIADDILLAIMIRTGQQGSSAIDLAHRLLNHFGSLCLPQPGTRLSLQRYQE